MIKFRVYNICTYTTRVLIGPGLVARKRRIEIIERTKYVPGGTRVRVYASFYDIPSAVAACQSLNRDRGIKPKEKAIGKSRRQGSQDPR